MVPYPAGPLTALRAQYRGSLWYSPCRHSFGCHTVGQELLLSCVTGLKHLRVQGQKGTGPCYEAGRKAPPGDWILTYDFLVHWPVTTTSLFYLSLLSRCMTRPKTSSDIGLKYQVTRPELGDPSNTHTLA